MGSVGALDGHASSSGLGWAQPHALDARCLSARPSRLGPQLRARLRARQPLARRLENGGGPARRALTPRSSSARCHLYISACVWLAEPCEIDVWCPLPHWLALSSRLLNTQRCLHLPPYKSSGSKRAPGGSSNSLRSEASNALAASDGDELAYLATAEQTLTRRPMQLAPKGVYRCWSLVGHVCTPRHVATLLWAPAPSSLVDLCVSDWGRPISCVRLHVHASCPRFPMSASW